MSGCATKDPKNALGRAPEHLNLNEKIALAGKTVALEVYSPSSLPLRKIEAVGGSAEECILDLARRGLEPKHYEYVLLRSPTS